MGRRLDIALGGVLLVVEADAEDVARHERREQLVDGGRLARVADAAEKVPFEQRGAAIVVEPAEVLAAGGEEADDFHRETVHTSSSGAVASPKVFSRTPILSMSER